MSDEIAADKASAKCRRLAFWKLALAILTVLVAYHGVLKFIVGWRMSALRARGIPMSVAEVESAYIKATAGVNLLEHYQRAFDAYVAPDIATREVLFSIEGLAIGDVEVEEHRAAIDAYVASNAEAYRLLQLVPDEGQVSRPLHLTFDYDPNADPMTFVTAVNRTTGLANLKLRLAAERNDPQGVIDAFRVGLRLAQTLDHEPLLIAALVRYSTRRRLFDALALAMDHLHFDAAALQQLQTIMADTHVGMEVFEAAWRGEAAMGNVYFDRPASKIAEDGPPFPAYRVTLNRITGLHAIDRLQYFTFLESIDDAAKLPLEQMYPRWVRLFEERDRYPAYCLLTGMVMWVSPTAVAGVLESVTNERAMSTVIAIERYRLAEGHLPATLSDLVPTYLTVVPDDPFRKSALTYRINDDGYNVYGHGRDGQDDGGKRRVGWLSDDPFDVGYAISR